MAQELVVIAEKINKFTLNRSRITEESNNNETSFKLVLEKYIIYQPLKCVALGFPLKCNPMT